MNTKGQLSNFLSLFTLLIFSLLQCNILNAQSLRKTFKYIETNDIINADAEIQEFNAKKDKLQESSEDYTLYCLAKCLVGCKETYVNYDPYKSLELFEETSNINSNKTEVDKFLEKHELSILKVHDIIYQSIYTQAKTINTEKGYQKALSVCHDCSYQDEIIKLKETAAFEETQSNQSVIACKYFLSNYPESARQLEIKSLMFQLAYNDATFENSLKGYKTYILAFSDEGNNYLPIAIQKRDSIAFSVAKSRNTLVVMEGYITEYSHEGNQYIPIAIDIRDSLAFNSLGKNYIEYKDFINKYPQSKFVRIANNKLPDLLFEEAQTKCSIILFETFVSDFPDDTRVILAKKKIEELEFESVLGNMTHDKIFRFKEKFPISIYNDSISLIVASILTNNDLKKAGLFGKVKFVQEHWMPQYLTDGTLFMDALDCSPAYYDEFGRLILTMISNDVDYDSIIYGRNGLKERILHINNRIVASTEYYFYNTNNKVKSKFVCQNCGYFSVKWLGKCPECGTWDSMVLTSGASTFLQY